MSQDMMQLAKDRVVEKLNAADQAAGRPMRAIDPAVWAGIFATVLQLVLECYKRRSSPDADPAAVKTSVARAMASPSFVQKLMIRKKMINEIGRKAYRQHGDEIHDKLMTVNEEATEVERLALVEQVIRGR